MFQLIKIEFKLLLGEREDEKTFPGNAEHFVSAEPVQLPRDGEEQAVTVIHACYLVDVVDLIKIHGDDRDDPPLGQHFAELP